jgi:hypothetical protein
MTRREALREAIETANAAERELSSTLAARERAFERLCEAVVDRARARRSGDADDIELSGQRVDSREVVWNEISDRITDLENVAAGARERVTELAGFVLAEEIDVKAMIAEARAATGDPLAVDRLIAARAQLALFACIAPRGYDRWAADTVLGEPINDSEVTDWGEHPALEPYRLAMEALRVNADAPIDLERRP